MKYQKILDISEDNERIYFSFYVNNEKRIIGLPKANCKNKAIYAGVNFKSLYLVDSNRANQFLTYIVRKSIMNHPISKFCNKETLKLLEINK